MGRGVGVTVVCPGFVDTGIFTRGEKVEAMPQMHPAPRWLRTSPQRVADRIMVAIQRERKLVVITPFARAMWRLNRFVPWLLSGSRRARFLFSRHRRHAR